MEVFCNQDRPVSEMNNSRDAPAKSVPVEDHDSISMPSLHDHGALISNLKERKRKRGSSDEDDNNNARQFAKGFKADSRKRFFAYAACPRTKKRIKRLDECLEDASHSPFPSWVCFPRSRNKCRGLMLLANVADCYLEWSKSTQRGSDFFAQRGFKYATKTVSNSNHESSPFSPKVEKTRARDLEKSCEAYHDTSGLPLFLENNDDGQSYEEIGWASGRCSKRGRSQFLPSRYRDYVLLN